MTGKYDHKQTTIKIDGSDICVDAELAPIISELNKLGIKTTHCCRGGNDFDPWKRAYISIDMSNIWIEVSNGILNIRWKLKS